MKKVLILGVNGFIGHHLSKRILETTDWDVYGMDMMSDRITDVLENPDYKHRMHFFEGDITINKEWVEYHVKKCGRPQSTASTWCSLRPPRSTACARTVNSIRKPRQ
jgi:nucleoside-diphosphate-sugar epimerase